MLTNRSLICLALVLGACDVKLPAAPPLDAGPVDAGSDAVDAFVEHDAQPPDMGQIVTGTSFDFRTGDALGSVQITTDGLATPLSTTTDATAGTYEIDHVPSSGSLFLRSTRTSYVQTRSSAFSIQTASTTKNVQVVSTAFYKSQYTKLGKAVDTANGVIIVDLVDTSGAPIAGIDLADIRVTNSVGQAVPANQIFFIGTSGDLDPSVTTSTISGTAPGHAYAIMVDMTPGAYTVIHPQGAGFVAIPVLSIQDGADVASSLDGTPTDTGTVATPKFAKDIYPRLQRASAGGLGCADCHHLGGQTPINFEDPPATVLSNIVGMTLVNLTTPATSILLTNPLYEAPPAVQDHPNATFLDTTDPNYQLFLTWITQGMTAGALAP